MGHKIIVSNCETSFKMYVLCFAWKNLIYKGNSGVYLSVCLSDKQGRAGAVTLAFPGRYLLAAPHEFLDQSYGFVCLWWQTGQGKVGQGQGKAGQPGQTPAHWTCWLYIGSLGKTEGPTSNQTKINFFKKIIFIIEHIKKTIIFLKKKIETK